MSNTIRSRVLSVPVIWESVNRRKDKSVSIRLSSVQEIPVNELAVMDTMFQKSGWMVFSEDRVQQVDIPDANTPVAEGKTPSQRLRNTLFIAWRDTTDQSETFDAYYARRYERFINSVKEELA